MPPTNRSIIGALRRVAAGRPSLVEAASEIADSGYWLAWRVSAQVDAQRLSSMLEIWQRAQLLPITVVVTPNAGAAALSPWRDHVQFLAPSTSAMGAMSAPGVAQCEPLVPAAARDAERVCAEFTGSMLAIDEQPPDTYLGPCFTTRAERDKSFVRATKAAFRSLTEGRIRRVSCWTGTERVIAACRNAARTFGLRAGDDYEFCLPSGDHAIGGRLLREGETVRIWFDVDPAVVERTSSAERSVAR